MTTMRTARGVNNSSPIARPGHPRIDNLTHGAESAPGEHSRRRVLVCDGVRAHDPDLTAAECERDESGCGFRGVSAVLMLRGHAVRNLDHPVSVRRRLEAARSNHVAVRSMHERETQHPWIDTRSGRDSCEPVFRELFPDVRVHVLDLRTHIVWCVRSQMETCRFDRHLRPFTPS